MAAFAAARSAFRSASTFTSAKNAASKFASAAAKPKASPSPFRTPTQKTLSHRIFRSPVEMSAISVETMLPFHTATASALLNSMLSAAPRSVGWSIEGLVGGNIVVIHYFNSYPSVIPKDGTTNVPYSYHDGLSLLFTALVVDWGLP